MDESLRNYPATPRDDKIKTQLSTHKVGNCKSNEFYKSLLKITYLS